MNIGLINIVVVIILAFVFSRSSSEKARKYYIIVTLLFLLVETSIRSLSVGSDTPNYYRMFQLAHQDKWTDMWDMFLNRYVYQQFEGDIGFQILQKMLSLFTDSWPLYVFVVDTLFFIPLGILLYRYTTNFKQVALGLCFYCALIHVIALSGGRQLLAMGFGILSFMSLESGNRKRALLYVVIGLTLHMSLLLCVLPIILSYLRVDTIKKIHAISFLVIPITILYSNTLISLMGNAIGSEKYAAYGEGEVAGGTEVFIFLLESLSLFFYVAFKKEDLNRNNLLKTLYIMVPLFGIFGPLIYSNGTMIRISLYFHLYIVLLLPYAVELFFKKNTNAIYTAMITILFLLVLTGSGSLKYHTFWEEEQTLFMYD